MGFLNPLFLLAAAAILVPVLLHLLHRRVTRRMAFPALRYLRRTESEHARRIRVRQLLLLLVRMSAVVLTVLAGARLFLRTGGGEHPPTAVVVILDNSLSSGAVRGEESVLDALKEAALAGLDDATPADRIWVLRIGEPWEVALPSTPEEARRRIRETGPSAASGDLARALRRAAALVEDSELAAAEIHLLSDLQLTALPAEGDGPIPLPAPLLVYRPPGDPVPNRWVSRLEVGGGSPPLAGQGSDVAARVDAAGDGGEEGEGVGEGERVEVPLRLVVDGELRAAASAAPGRDVLLSLPALGDGVHAGYVETEPDALRSDDRRHFTVRVRRPPRVAVAGSGSFFLSEALAVLRERGRIRVGGESDADVLVSGSGEGLSRSGIPRAAVILPPGDPVLLPALNRRLAAARIPWRYRAVAGDGEARPVDLRLPVDLSATRVLRWYRLEPVGDTDGLPAEVRARLSGGDPWIVSGRTAEAAYLLFGSPLDPDATDVPVSAAMIPLLEWALTRWSAGRTERAGVEAGSPLSLPPHGSAVRAPDGTVHPVDGTRMFRATRLTGVYEILDGDSVVEGVAVNSPLRESLLDRAGLADLEDRLGEDARGYEDAAGWSGAVFARRRGPEPWKPLLLALCLLLLAESWIAAPGGRPESAGGPVSTTRTEERARLA